MSSATGAELTGKRALVTGGTRGIGKGITDRLRAAGATVIVAARTAPDAPTEGFVKADVSTVSGTSALAERTLELLGGGLEILIHNVGGSDIKPGGTSVSARMGAPVIARPPPTAHANTNSIQNTASAPSRVGSLFLRIRRVRRMGQ